MKTLFSASTGSIIALVVGVWACSPVYAQTYVGHYEATANPWPAAGIPYAFDISGTFVFENKPPLDSVQCDEPAELEFGPCIYAVISHTITIKGQCEGCGEYTFESVQNAPTIIAWNYSPTFGTTDRFAVGGSAGLPHVPGPAVFNLGGPDDHYLIDFGISFEKAAALPDDDPLTSAALPLSTADLDGFLPTNYRYGFISFGVVGGSCCGSHGGAVTAFDMTRVSSTPVEITFDDITPGLQADTFLAAYGVPMIVPGGASGAAGPRVRDITGDWGFHAPSAPNIFYQHWTAHNTGLLHWLDFYFEPELAAFSLTRVGLDWPRSFNPWGAEFYDEDNNLIGEFHECEWPPRRFCGQDSPPPTVFAFEAPPGKTIKKMRLWSNWFASTTRNIFVDDFMLTPAFLDLDGDGVEDELDNCPTVYNPGQEQTGNNVGGEFGDACVDPTVDIPDNADIAADVTIGADSTINTGVTVESGAELGDDVTLNRNSSVGEDTVVGDNTSVNQGAEIGSSVMIGVGASVGSNVIVGDGVEIGDNVILSRNVIIGDHVTIGDNTFIGQASDIGNHAEIGMNVVLGKNVSVLESAIVADFANIPKNAVITP